MGAYTKIARDMNKKVMELNELLDKCNLIKNELEELTKNLKLEKSEKQQAKRLLSEFRNTDDKDKILDDISKLSKEYQVGAKEVFKYKMSLFKLEDKISALLDIDGIDIQFR